MSEQTPTGGGATTGGPDESDQPVDPVRLSVVIPAYCEVDSIADTIHRVRDELGPLLDGALMEVIVVDDGSLDGTAAAAFSADLVVALPENRGKGAAVRAGVMAAAGSTVAFTDADLSYAPAQIARLLDAVEAGADMVAGSRYHPDTTTVVEAGALRRVGGRAVNAATRVVLHGSWADTQCGLKAFRGDVARELFSKSRVDGFAFDVELFALAERAGHRIVEVPVEVENSDRSTVRVVRDATRLLADIGRIRWSLWRGRYDLE